MNPFKTFPKTKETFPFPQSEDKRQRRIQNLTNKGQKMKRFIQIINNWNKSTVSEKILIDILVLYHDHQLKSKIWQHFLLSLLVTLSRHFLALCEKCLDAEFCRVLASTFPHSEYGNLRSRSPYSVQIRENIDHNKLCISKLFTVLLACLS